MLPDYFPPSSTKPHFKLHQRGAIYIAFWIGVGLLLAIAQLQIYVRSGGQHLWAPFLWELSSVTAVAALMPLIYRWRGHDFNVDKKCAEKFINAA